MKFASLIVGALLLVGCAPEPTAMMPVVNDSTIQVERLGVIKDDLAYNDRRGIYRITDTKTGQTWIGVSGVGITEIGQHSCGKGCITSDER